MIVKPDDAVLDYYQKQKQIKIAEKEAHQFFQKYEQWRGTR